MRVLGLVPVGGAWSFFEADDMRIHINKRVHLVTPANYVVAGRSIATYTVAGERYVILKLDRRIPKRRARLTLIQPRVAREA